MDARNLPYSSALAERIVAYLDCKASLGFENRTRGYVLLYFDRWCAENGAESLDKAAVRGWLEQRGACVSATTLGGWMSVIRDFATYLQAEGDLQAYVLPAGEGPRAARPTPYLLTQEEAEAFFAAIPAMEWRSPMRWQATCMFGLMYACGLRPTETRRLRPCDVRPDTLEIDIVESKGNRSRRLPVTEEVMGMVEASDARTAELFGAERPYLFASGSGGQISADWLSRVFSRIWRAAGLPSERWGSKPASYLFRHHFAYANVERWAAEGRDADAMLPYLSRYMGHSKVECTLYYVHTSPDFMAGYADAAAGLDGLLPEVGFDG